MSRSLDVLSTASPGTFLPSVPFIVVIAAVKDAPDPEVVDTRPECQITSLNQRSNPLPVISSRSVNVRHQKRKTHHYLVRCLFYTCIVLFLSYFAFLWWKREDDLFRLSRVDLYRFWSLLKTGSLLWVTSANLKISHSHNPMRTSSPYELTTSRGKPSNGTRQLPQVIIIGVKKGGTRALLEYIRMHPQVRAPGSEMHFFDRHYERGIDWYRNQMPLTTDAQITIEKTPSYFVTRDVPSRVFKMNKKMKLIIVVRDPITRAISDYTQARSKGRSTRSFQEMAFYSNGSHRLLDTSWGALRIGLYAQHLEKWLKYFPLEQMLFVSGEELIENPAGQMDRVQQFLGLEKVIRAQHFYYDHVKGFPCLRRPEVQLRPRCLGKSKGRRHPRIAPDVIAQLREFYKPFNQKFYRMVGKDFAWQL